ncbi:MAG: hypothetical protein WED33_07615 [Bacteroidia bacterium]
MIKKNSLVLRLFALLFFINNNSNCQNIGLLFNMDLSKDNKVNHSFGGGFNFFWPISKEKLEIHLTPTFAFNRERILENDRSLTNDGIVTNYSRYGSSATTLYVMPISDYIKIKAGAIISYNYISFSITGFTSNFIKIQTLSSVGAGLATNFNFKLRKEAKCSFDIILNSTYLFEVNSSGPLPDYASLRNTVLYSILIGTSIPL